LVQEHTPADDYGFWYHQISAGDGFSKDGFTLSGIVSPADARLIAAAPDLLRVAELLVDWLDEEEGAHALCDTARAAIAKARGA